MGLTAAAIYCSIVFSNHGGRFSATMVRFAAAQLWHEKSSIDLNIRPLKPPEKLLISEMPAQYVANFWGRTIETARGFFKQPAGLIKADWKESQHPCCRLIYEGRPASQREWLN
jgi:hypothetical protein